MTDLIQTPVFQVMMVLHNPDWERVRPKFEPRGTSARPLSPVRITRSFGM